MRITRKEPELDGVMTPTRLPDRRLAAIPAVSDTWNYNVKINVSAHEPIAVCVTLQAKIAMELNVLWCQ